MSFSKVKKSKDLFEKYLHEKYITDFTLYESVVNFNPTFVTLYYKYH